jgi:hypothetical protein
MTNFTFDTTGAEIFDQGAKGQNWQGSIKKITENNNVDEQVSWQSGAKSNSNGDDDDKKYKNFHDHCVVSLQGNISLS